jgi:predicted pyridoxine 5'-phosphate oxidase superfamily flavin-nucleotide-binding protein
VDQPLIEPEVAALMESGCSLIVGTVDADGVPEATRGFGLRVVRDEGTLRVVVAADASITQDNLHNVGRVAVTATDVATLRSTQVKGRTVSVHAVTDADRAVFARYHDEFFTALQETDGTPLDLVVRMLPADIAAFVMTVDEVFDQTPGPAAGARLAPEAT